MKTLAKYIIPFSGLKQGLHEYEFKIGNEFFNNFEHSTVKKGTVDLKLYLDRRSTMMELNFLFEGKVEAECDRCLDLFFLPIKGDANLIVKFAEEETESEDVDIIFIDKNSNELDLSIFIYEFILLSVPISKIHEDADESCSEDITEFLKQDEPEKKTNNPFRDALKDFNKN